MLPYIQPRAARGAWLALGAVASLGLAACSDSSNLSGPGGDVRVIITAPTDSVFEGDLIQLGARVLDGTSADVPGATIAWSVSDTTIAKVNATGAMLLLKPGTVRVTARNGNRSATHDVGIGRLVVKEVAITPSSLRVGRGDIAPLQISVKGQGQRQILGRDIHFTSDDSTVVIPESQGFVVARTAGTTTVRATVDGVTATLPVQVVVADTTFALTEFNGAALPAFLSADSVMWDGVAEYHELYVERGTMVLSGLLQLRYTLDIRYTEYKVFTEGSAVRREVRRTAREFDRGIIDVGAQGRLAMTSEFISPLAHTADQLSDGYLVHFRTPGDDIIWNVKYRRLAP